MERGGRDRRVGKRGEREKEGKEGGKRGERGGKEGEREERGGRMKNCYVCMQGIYVWYLVRPVFG